MKSVVYFLLVSLYLLVPPGNLPAQSQEDRVLMKLRELVDLAEEALPLSSARAAELSSNAITLANRIKQDSQSDLNLRQVSQQQIRAYLILGDAFRSEGNDRKAARYYRQGYSLADAIHDPAQFALAESKLISIGRSPADIGTRITNFSREVLDDLENMVEDGRMDEEVKSSAETATLSVLEFQAKNAERRGNYVQAITLYTQTLPYHVSSGDSTQYKETCNTISILYNRIGNAPEAERYGMLSRGISRTHLPEMDISSAPNAVKDLRELVEEAEAREEEFAREEAAANQERLSYLEEAEALMRSGNVEESFLSFRKASLLQQEIARMRRRHELDSAANAHFVESQFQEIELLTQQQEIQAQNIREAKRTRNSLMIGSTLILAIAGLSTWLFLTKRRAHKTLSDTYFQLNKAHEDLKTTQTKLVEAEKMASLGQLTAGIAHEINNPVNFISGNLHPLREDLGDLLKVLQLYETEIKARGLEDEFREVLEAKEDVELNLIQEEIQELMSGIEEGASRTSEIVKGLRTFARMDGGEPQVFDLHEGLDSTLALLKNQLEDIEVIRQYDASPEIEGFPGRINQVFMNLLSNAIHAMPDGGWLEIKTRTSREDWITVSIQDTGSGITEDIRKKIFDPFFTTKDVGKGTGLGLAISLGIVQQHGGEITVDSQPGHGTCMTISLPVKSVVVG